MPAVEPRKAKGGLEFEGEISSIPDLHGHRPEDLFVIRQIQE
jgi:hypothetical protein